MPMKKTKKRRKMSRMRGTGTHGGGARKKRKKSGHRGGAGMSGSGKRSDHKKTLVLALYGHDYFGKQGVTSRGTKKDKRMRINLEDLELALEKYGKKSGDKWEVELKGYKILGSSENHILKNKIIIKAKDASKSAIEKVRKAGGGIILAKKESKEEEKGQTNNKSVKLTRNKLLV